MDFEAATQTERRRDFARRYVVEQAIGALLRTDIDLSAVTANGSIEELGLGAAFIARLAEDFGWAGILPQFETLGDLADFFTTHYTRESRSGGRMDL